MSDSSNIRNMLKDKQISVPDYQRAYSWDVGVPSDSSRQVNQFLEDLEEYTGSKTKDPYYLGQFLFEKRDDGKFAVIDGQQRLTTIIIFLCALFRRLQKLDAYGEKEQAIYADMVRSNSCDRFETVELDRLSFINFIIDGKPFAEDKKFDTESARRFCAAYKFFTTQFKNKSVDALRKLLNAVCNASCTTHIIAGEAEATQIFLFQNNRGKKPTNLEVIKAEFMFHIHLYGGEQKGQLFRNLKACFESIYRFIAMIEQNIDEDSVLLWALRVYCNNLQEENALQKIEKILSDKKWKPDESNFTENSISFISKFSALLADCFSWLRTFYLSEGSKSLQIQSLISLGSISSIMPFVLKTYQFGLNLSEREKLCKALGDIVVRDLVIGTRAILAARLQDVYREFNSKNPSIQPIIDHIEWMKTVDPEEDGYFCAYWNNDNFLPALRGYINPRTAKFLLWRYENYLQKQGKTALKMIKFSDLDRPELEHIAPQTENEEQASGYGEYDDDFRNNYLNCLGNYLILSKPHNIIAGNKPFICKLKDYNKLAQQREVQQLADYSPQDGTAKTWGKQLIKRRTKIISKALLEMF